MSEAYGHLHASIRSAADDSAELRIRRIRTDRWVSYTRAESALASMEDLLNLPKRTRMPNLLLVGPDRAMDRAHGEPATSSCQASRGSRGVAGRRIRRFYAAWAR